MSHIESFDPTKVASDFIENRYQDFLLLAESLVRYAHRSAKLHLRSTYSQYIKQTFERYSTTKSFLLRDSPQPLYNFYVPLAVRHGNKLIEIPVLQDFTKKSPNSIILASAGSGKSIFMKHLLLNALISKAHIPLFVELRNLNAFDGSISEFIFHSATQLGLNVDPELFWAAIKRGLFVLLLDGLDEINSTLRSNFITQLSELQAVNPLLTTILSSRPDNALEGLPRHAVLRLEPLSLVQAIRLVNKLPFDRELKERFTDDLEKVLFERHKSFASNPLLLSIMLLTYGQSASIPDKLTVFYNQAYEALFERHDSLKGGFRRNRKTPLDIQAFGRVFSAFCLQTYDSRSFSFSKSTCLELISRASEIVQIRVEPESYLFDARESVGLLVDDGTEIVFPHRSFQEYFTAKFISDSDGPIQQRLVDKYSVTLRQDSLIKMLHEMKPEIVENLLILPTLDKIFERIGVKKSVTMTAFLRYLKLGFTSIDVSPSSVNLSVESMKNYHFVEVLNFATNACASLIGYKPKLKGIKAFQSKYGSPEAVHYPLSSIKVRDEFLRDFANLGGYHSLQQLEAALKIRNALRNKAQTIRASLEDILA